MLFKELSVEDSTGPQSMEDGWLFLEVGWFDSVLHKLNLGKRNKAVYS